MRTLWITILCSSCALADVEPAEARVCPTMTVENADDLREARTCSEIDGDLVLRGSTLERIELPLLRRVHGSLISVGARLAREIVLPQLREVGTEGAENLLEIGFDADSLQRIAMPELRVVHGSLGIAALGGLRELDLRSLERVDEKLGLINLPQLDRLLMSDGVAADGGAWFELLCELDDDELPRTQGPEPELRACEPVKTR